MQETKWGNRQTNETLFTKSRAEIMINEVETVEKDRERERDWAKRIENYEMKKNYQQSSTGNIIQSFKATPTVDNAQNTTFWKRQTLFYC